MDESSKQLPLVKATDVARRFRQGDAFLDALLPASFEVHDGDRIAVVGPSGSGKSTLLQLIAGLDTPTGGRLVWPAFGAPRALRPVPVGIVLQTPSLVPTLSAAENVELALRIAGVRTALRERTAAALAQFGVAELADKVPEELSGGQAQRVALARALAPEPRLVLADEPTGQLDQNTAAETMDALLATVAGIGASLMVATHDLAVATRLRSVWHMDHGRLEAAQAVA